MSDMHIDEMKNIQVGKEQTGNLETPVEKNIEEKAKSEKKPVAKPAESKKETASKEETAQKEEAPKKKKNIIRVYHAQNASDGGRKRRPEGARPVRPSEEGGDRAQRPGQGRPVRPAAEGAEKWIRLSYD